MRYPIVLFAVILIATALLTKTAAAGLGWTLKECKKHYGEPTSRQTHALGIVEYTFSAKGFLINLETDQKGKVGYIAYIKSSIEDELAMQLLEQNAPKATWEIQSGGDPNRKTWWGYESGSQKYVVVLLKNVPIPAGTGDALTIGTSEFHRFEELSKKQEAKDQASGL